MRVYAASGNDRLLNLQPATGGKKDEDRKDEVGRGGWRGGGV